MDDINKKVIHNVLEEPVPAGVELWHVLTDDIKAKTSQENDPINPNHYKTGKLECLEVMREVIGHESVMDFCICNAFKYIYRYKKKNGIEDIKKAVWYLNKYLELYEGEKIEQ